MKNKVYLGIVIRIVLLFATAMAFTFIPDYLRDFFGDTKHICEIKVTDWGDYCKDHGDIDQYWNWGARHFWYFIMCILLFTLSLVNVVISVFNLVDKNK